MQRVPLASLDALKGQGKQMLNRSSFRLNRSGLLLALISAAFAGQAQAAAGRVEFAIGPVSVVGADGRTRPAARGTEVDTGDTVRTQQNGRVQVRMADGAYISLQPNTEFGIKDYRFAGKTDGSENAFYSLLKGAMRTVTGLIGRVNRNKYLVSTPTATVGIRGTGGVIQVQDDGSTLVQGTSGIWFLANPSGTIDIPAGVSGVAPSDPNQPPQETSDVPTSGPAPLPPQQDFAQGEERDSTGENIITPPSPTGMLTSGSGYTGTIAYCCTFTSPWIVSMSSATATFDGLGRMTEIADPLGQKFTSDGVSIVDYGNDGLIAWGRWTGTVTGQAEIDGMNPINETYNANQGLHYVVGMPTPRLPTTGSATYTLIGATRPTYTDGLLQPGTFSGSLDVSFGAASATVTANFTVTMTDNVYGMNGSTTASSANFSMSPTVTGCFSGCSGLIEGFFAGASAERAGVGYHIVDFGTNKDVLGAAAFEKK
jgi:hypothetical protein